MTRSKQTPKLSDIELPEAAWTGPLERYRDIVAPISESPLAYHWAAAVTVIGQLFGRQVHTYYARDIYLNFFFLLLGPTGVKKSTPLNMALRLRQSIPGGDQITDLSGISSPEGLIQKLQEAPDGRAVIYEDEMRQLLKKAQATNNGGMIPQLNKLYDCPPTAEVNTRANPLKVEKPVVSLIAGATAESLEDCVGDNEVFGGLFNRIIPVSGELRKPQPWPERPDDGAWNRLVADIDAVVSHYTRPTCVVIERHRGLTESEVQSCPCTGCTWERFYVGFAIDHRTRPDDVFTAMVARMHTHVWRLAVFYAALRGAPAVGSEDLNRALAIGGYVYQVTEAAMEPLSASKTTRLDNRILAILREKPLGRRYLRQRLGGRFPSPDVDRAIKTLLSLEPIVEDAHTGILAVGDRYDQPAEPERGEAA